MHTEMDGGGESEAADFDGDVFIPDPDLGLKRTKSLVFREYVPIKTLGNGRFGLVKEAMHVKTGKHVAMKIINKAQLKKHELLMIENEIEVLEKVSRAHPNVIHLYAHFTIANELYLIMDLCTGGELFDLICDLGSFFEDDAQRIVHTLLDAVRHLHENGVVHRDLKPENILIRSPVDALGEGEEPPPRPAGTEPPPKFLPRRDIVLADFGISKMLDEGHTDVLKTRIGSPGYMAPEVIKGHKYGKAVDMWAIGIITYLLLAGSMPFRDDAMFDEMQNIMLGRYAFEPKEQWENISDEAKDFIRKCLSSNPADRPTAQQALDHAWLKRTPETHQDALLHASENLHNPHPEADLLPIVIRNFDAKRRFRRAVHTVRMLNRLNVGMSEYARRMDRLGRYGVDTASSFSSTASVESDGVVMRHSATFDTLSVAATPAVERRMSPDDPAMLLLNGAAERHHVRKKSSTKSIERTLTLPL
ncbi:Pkinase-domain-containing protein [Hyaloraphidium curvatum]|nr:Pkinase-domain-containing protein [Hyaloraphidium curvatum]